MTFLTRKSKKRLCNPDIQVFRHISSEKKEEKYVRILGSTPGKMALIIQYGRHYPVSKMTVDQFSLHLQSSSLVIGVNISKYELCMTKNKENRCYGRGKPTVRGL